MTSRASRSTAVWYTASSSARPTPPCWCGGGTKIWLSRSRARSGNAQNSNVVAMPTCRQMHSRSRRTHGVNGTAARQALLASEPSANEILLNACHLQPCGAASKSSGLHDSVGSERIVE